MACNVLSGTYKFKRNICKCWLNKKRLLFLLFYYYLCKTIFLLDDADGTNKHLKG